MTGLIKLKVWGSKITRPILRHSSNIWLFVLRVMQKTLVTQGVQAVIRNEYFPDTSRKIHRLDQPGLFMLAAIFGCLCKEVVVLMLLLQ
jgi:hypothetical protein